MPRGDSGQSRAIHSKRRQKLCVGSTRIPGLMGAIAVKYSEGCGPKDFEVQQESQVGDIFAVVGQHIRYACVMNSIADLPQSGHSGADNATRSPNLSECI